jgi:hypothetical protein
MFLLNGCGMQNKKENAESTYRNVKNTVSGKKQQNQVELVENSPTIGTDIMEAKKVVSSIPGYIPDSVWINGNQMWVVVRANKDLSNHAKLKEAARIHEKLVQAIPQFEINVKVN